MRITYENIANKRVSLAISTINLKCPESVTLQYQQLNWEEILEDIYLAKIIKIVLNYHNHLGYGS